MGLRTSGLPGLTFSAESTLSPPPPSIFSCTSYYFARHLLSTLPEVVIVSSRRVREGRTTRCLSVARTHSLWHRICVCTLLSAQLSFAESAAFQGEAFAKPS